MEVKSEREVAQSSPTLFDPMDCSPPGSPVPGILAKPKKYTNCSKPTMMKVMKLECKTKVKLSEMLDSNNM